MEVPVAARSAAAVVGAVLVLVAGISVVETLIVPRAVSSRLTRWVDRIVTTIFRVAGRRIAEYPTAGPTSRRAGARHPARSARRVVRDFLRWLLVAAVAVRPRRHHLGVHLGRIFAVHLGLRGTPGRRARSHCVRGGCHRVGDRHAPDRLPANVVRGLQPPGDRGSAAERARRRAVVGAGVVVAYPLRTGIRRVNAQHACPTYTSDGNAGRPTSQKATLPICPWCGSDRRGRCRHG